MLKHTKDLRKGPYITVKQNEKKLHNIAVYILNNAKIGHPQVVYCKCTNRNMLIAHYNYTLCSLYLQLL